MPEGSLIYGSDGIRVKVSVGATPFIVWNHSLQPFGEQPSAVTRHVHIPWSAGIQVLTSLEYAEEVE